MNIHHIGYLVKNMDRSILEFEKLGYSLEGPSVYDEGREIQICFLDKDGYRVELVSPTSHNSVVANMIGKYRNSPYHICYETEDFKKTVAQLCSSGYLQIDEPTAAPALGGNQVVFLMSPIIGIIEILYKNKDVI